MMDSLDDYIRSIDELLAIAKAQAEAAASRHNEKLSLLCPECSSEGYVPGLRCSCGYKAPLANAWQIVRSNEWGYELVPISSQRSVVHAWRVDM